MHVDDVSDYWTLWREFERRRRPREPEWEKRLLRESPDEAPVSGDPIDAYLHALVAQARTSLGRIETDIYVRAKLHDQAIAQVDYQITEAAGALERFAGWGVGYNRGVDEKRLALERRLDTLRHEKRSMRIKFWDDMVRLRADLDVQRNEYHAMARRMKLR